MTTTTHPVVDTVSRRQRFGQSDGNVGSRGLSTRSKAHFIFIFGVLCTLCLHTSLHRTLIPASLSCDHALIEGMAESPPAWNVRFRRWKNTTNATTGPTETEVSLRKSINDIDEDPSILNGTLTSMDDQKGPTRPDSKGQGTTDRTTTTGREMTILDSEEPKQFQEGEDGLPSRTNESAIEPVRPIRDTSNGRYARGKHNISHRRHKRAKKDVVTNNETDRHDDQSVPTEPNVVDVHKYSTSQEFKNTTITTTANNETDRHDDQSVPTEPNVVDVHEYSTSQEFENTTITTTAIVPRIINWHGIHPWGFTEPSDFIKVNYTDPLSDSFNSTSLHELNLTIGVPYLGVLLDAGRQYYPINWIKRMIDVISAMKYNLLHFRLTDDQTFNVQLQSQPMLAYPTPLDGNKKVYQPDELRDIVQYARSKGIVIIPEINVPGHAGAWAGIPDLIVQCPEFISKLGYGVPLNVSNPKLRHVLKDVLEEVIAIFDNPPFLHLGGDELEMSRPCFQEVGEFNVDHMPFERMLRKVIVEVGYNLSQVIRWEMTSHRVDYPRAGKITHFWFRKPGEPLWHHKYNETTFTNPVFLSSGLYFDTNEHDAAWEVYLKTKQLKHQLHKKSPVLGIIAGTFELGTRYWYERNVIGRLLAVAIGVSDISVATPEELYDVYAKLCKSSGLGRDFCLLYGFPPRDFSDFRREHKTSIWKQWIHDTRDRLTYEAQVVEFTESGAPVIDAKTAFSEARETKSAWRTVKNVTMDEAKQDLLGARLRGNRLVENIGMVVDLSSYPTYMSRLEHKVLPMMRRVGLNIVQLRLVDDFSFGFHSSVFPSFFYTQRDLYRFPHPNVTDLVTFRAEADLYGIAIMPEISISTNAGGFYNSNFNVPCREFTCHHGKYIPQKINSGAYVFALTALINEVLQFTSSEYLHLGYDERITSSACFLEAAAGPPGFDVFEQKLASHLMNFNVTSARVVRWENNEKKHYPTRLGEVTQCRTGEDTDCSEKSEKFFGTVNILRGGPWKIYETSRKLASQSTCVGVIAEIGALSKKAWLQNQVEMRLVAFSLGAMDVPAMTEVDFRKQFVLACSDYLRSSGQTNVTTTCTEFASWNEDAKSYYDLNDDYARPQFRYFVNSTCAERTRVVNRRHFRTGEIRTAVSMNADSKQ